MPEPRRAAPALPAFPAFTALTWNVNSIRVRLDRLLGVLERHAPDVACLQELKVTEDDFPFDAVREAGYHAAVFGQRTYNGVAILSRAEPRDVERGLGDGVDDPEARLIAATVRGVRVVSVYAPNGQVVGSDKWEYKLAWLGRLRRWLDHADAAMPLLLGGDWNVAPTEGDVAFPDQWRTSVLCHEEGRVALRALVDWGLTDAVRLHHEGPGPWTWWDYRMLGFPKGNGLRIDHILVTRPLAEKCVSAEVDREERKGKQPSDHAPVVVAFAEG